MPPKKNLDPFVVDAMKRLSPNLFEKQASSPPTPGPTNLDFMSDEECRAASSKGGQTTQRRRHASAVAAPETARQLSEIGTDWERALRTGADTTGIKQAVQGIVQPCFRNGLPNADAIKMLNKYASPLRVQQHGESVHVQLMVDSTPEIIVKAK